jgi:preprotein translocase subunit SecG
MLTTLVIIVHVMVCIALILIILLQSGKGADIGAAFGGGSSQTVFGSTGATPFLSKVTIVAAVIFMVTSFVLTYFSGKGMSVSGGSMVTEQAPIGAPAPDSMPLPGPVPEQEKSQAGSSEPSAQREDTPSVPAASATSPGAGERTSAPSPGSGGPSEVEKK